MRTIRISLGPTYGTSGWRARWRMCSASRKLPTTRDATTFAGRAQFGVGRQQTWLGYLHGRQVPQVFRLRSTTRLMSAIQTRRTALELSVVTTTHRPKLRNVRGFSDPAEGGVKG